MGTYIHLSIGRLEIDWGKNDGYRDHACLFQPGDLAQVPYYYVDDEKGSFIDAEGKTHYHLYAEYQDGMSKPLGLVADRLELLGHSLESCANEFVSLNELGESGKETFTFDDLMQAFVELDVNAISYDGGTKEKFEKFLRRSLIKRFGPQATTEAHELDLDDLSTVESLSAYTILRLMALNPNAQDLPVNWQFADSEASGWIDRRTIVRPLDASHRFLVVTEGSSDAHIMQHALKLLKPHLADFFDFVDMQEGYPFSGTGNLLKFLKGLISISIRNNVLVVYDNDTEGVTNYEKSCALNIPPNMFIMKLPDRANLKQFSTVGPNGQHKADINGCAAAIECYLDLEPDALVRWTSFNDKINRYQGELLNKTQAAKDFLSQRTRLPGYNYSGIEAVLDGIIESCIAIQKKIVRHLVDDN